MLINEMAMVTMTSSSIGDDIPICIKNYIIPSNLRNEFINEYEKIKMMDLITMVMGVYIITCLFSYTILILTFKIKKSTFYIYANINIFLLAMSFVIDLLWCICIYKIYTNNPICIQIPYKDLQFTSDVIINESIKTSIVYIFFVVSYLLLMQRYIQMNYIQVIIEDYYQI